MAVPTVALSETSPAGSDLMSTVDNRLREYKTQVREVLSVDHDFPTTGSTATAGQHKKVILQEQADLGTGAVSATILGSQTVSGKGELVYTDEDNNDVQITSGGKIKAENLSGVYPAANVAALATMMNLIYPIGSFYANKTDATNPGTLLGVGTWTAVQEQVLVGYKSGSVYFGTPGASVGADTTTLTSAQSGVPAHTHSQSTADGDGGAGASVFDSGSGSGPYPVTISIGANTPADAAQAHSNIQKSLVVYLWVRTA